MLNTYVTYIGCFTLFAIGCGVLAWIWYFVTDILETRREKLFYKALDAAKIQLGRVMIQESYWLKGDQMKLMHLMGVKFSQHNGYDIAKLREELETYEVK